MNKIIDYIMDNEWLFYLLVLVVIFGVVFGVYAIKISSKRNAVDGGVLVDKQILPDQYGRLKFYFIVGKGDKLESFRVDETEYYTYDIGDIFHK